MADAYDEELAARIDHLCQQIGIGEVAAAAGLPRETLRRYRRGHTSPPLEFLEALCLRFDVSAEWLLCGRGPMRRGDLPGASLHAAGPQALIAALDELVVGPTIPACRRTLVTVHAESASPDAGSVIVRNAMARPARSARRSRENSTTTI